MIQLFLTDPDTGNALLGMPTHLHEMAGHACILLIKIGSRGLDGLVQLDYVYDLTTRLAQALRSVRVTKWHPAHMVADGLEKSAASLLREHGGDFGGDDLGRVGEKEDASGISFHLGPVSQASTSAALPPDLGPDPVHGPYLSFGEQAEMFEFDPAQRGLGDDRLGFL